MNELSIKKRIYTSCKKTSGFIWELNGAASEGVQPEIFQRYSGLFDEATAKEVCVYALRITPTREALFEWRSEIRSCARNLQHFKDCSRFSTRRLTIRHLFWHSPGNGRVSVQLQYPMWSTRINPARSNLQAQFSQGRRIPYCSLYFLV